MSEINIRSLEFRKQIFLAMLQEGPVAVLVAAHKEVVVADTVAMPCVLHYGLNMPVPIPNFQITDQGIVAILSFNRTPWETFVPWEAVVAIERMDGSFGIKFVDTGEIKLPEQKPAPTEKRMRRAILVAVPDDTEKDPPTQV